MRECGISELPNETGNLTNLKDLQLDENKLKALPWTLFKANSLQRIFLKKNPLQFPFRRYEKIVEGKEVKELLELLKNFYLGTEKWPQLKLVTLGHGSSGKVSESFLFDFTPRQRF